MQTPIYRFARGASKASKAKQSGFPFYIHAHIYMYIYDHLSIQHPSIYQPTPYIIIPLDNSHMTTSLPFPPPHIHLPKKPHFAPLISHAYTRRHTHITFPLLSLHPRTQNGDISINLFNPALGTTHLNLTAGRRSRGGGVRDVHLPPLPG
jgi:hypothetical protein